MKHSYRWYYWGIITFSFVLGIIIALSKSPVAGAAITAVLGLGGALVSVMAAKKEAKADPTKNQEVNFRMVGKTLVAFSLSLFAGIGAVIGIRFAATPVSAPPRSFVWDDKHKPTSAHEALDWIKVTDILEKAGYSRDQVRAIYDMRDPSKNLLGEKWYETPYYQTIQGIEYLAPSGGLEPLNIANQIDPMGILNPVPLPSSPLEKKPA